MRAGAAAPPSHTRSYDHDVLAVDIFFVVIVLALIIAATAYKMNRANIKALTQPERDLARAVRILDRILAVDDAFPQIPSDLRQEAKAFTAEYYKELNQ